MAHEGRGNLNIKGRDFKLVYIFQYCITFFETLFAYISKWGIKMLEMLRWGMVKKEKEKKEESWEPQP